MRWLRYASPSYSTHPFRASLTKSFDKFIFSRAQSYRVLSYVTLRCPVAYTGPNAGATASCSALFRDRPGCEEAMVDIASYHVRALLRLCLPSSAVRSSRSSFGQLGPACHVFNTVYSALPDLQGKSLLVERVEAKISKASNIASTLFVVLMACVPVRSMHKEVSAVISVVHQAVTLSKSPSGSQ